MLTGATWSGVPMCVLNSTRISTVYLADFVTYGSERYFSSTNLKEGKTRIERVSNEAFERFIRNVLTMPDPLNATSNVEVSE
ncbi:hypothetical protein NXC24_CH02344 [Rhizobium sp. NXC24]|nr:hypothetical protein NXC24_CH02344 [Rhizobium sp. NXC24]